MDLNKTMTITVTTSYATTPAVPDSTEMFGCADFIPYTGHRVMYGFTGGAGGPRRDYSRPFSDRCVCNQCAVEWHGAAAGVGSRCSGGPGQFIPLPPGLDWSCALCGKKGNR